MMLSIAHTVKSGMDNGNWMMNGQEFGRDWSWYNWGTILASAYWEWGKPWRTWVRRTNFAAKFRTEYLQNIRLNCVCSIISFTYSSVALEPFVWYWLLLQFRSPFCTDGTTPSTSDQPVARPLPSGQYKQRINAYTHQTPIPWVGFEPTIPAFELAKTVHALDFAAIEIGVYSIIASLKYVYVSIRVMKVKRLIA
jgi:hypothetical protein